MAVKAPPSQAALQLIVKGPAPRFPPRRAGIDGNADLRALRRRIAFPHAGENRGVESLHGKLDQGDIAEEARIEHARRDALPGGEQPHAALAHADDGVGAVGKPIGEETAERGRSVSPARRGPAAR
jgi:hypothetical protein